VFVPGFISDTSNASIITLFTTRIHYCANSNISTGHSTLRTRAANVPSTWTARQVNAHAQHGRKTHVRTHFAATVNPSHVFSKIHVEKMEQLNKEPLLDVYGKKAGKRFLLAVNTPKTRSVPTPASLEAIDLENATHNGGVAREITVIDNNERVAAVVCGSPGVRTFGNSTTCDLMSVEKEVPIDLFCREEATFMQQAGGDIRMQLLNASSSAVSDIVITSVARSLFHQKCDATVQRHLLQVETVHLTYVVVVSGSSFIDNDVLVSNGYSGLQRITTSEQTRLSVCRSSQSNNKPQDAICAQIHATSTATPIPLSPTANTTPVQSNASTNTQHTESDSALSQHFVIVIIVVSFVIFLCLAIVLFVMMWKRCCQTSQVAEPVLYAGLYQNEDFSDRMPTGEFYREQYTTNTNSHWPPPYYG